MSDKYSYNFGGQRLIDANALIKKRAQAKDFHPDMFVIGQGYVMDAPTIPQGRITVDINYNQLRMISCIIESADDNEINVNGTKDGIQINYWSSGVPLNITINKDGEVTESYNPEVDD